MSCIGTGLINISLQVSTVQACIGGELCSPSIRPPLSMPPLPPLPFVFASFCLPFWQNLTQWSTAAAPATLSLPGLFFVQAYGQ